MRCLNQSINIIRFFLFLAIISNNSFSQNEVLLDSSDFNDIDSEFIGFSQEKSPWGAVLRSAVIPGFGQFYNESYWKIPIILGIGAYYVYEWDYLNGMYKKNQKIYFDGVQKGAPDPELRRKRDFYRDQRDLFAIYLGLVYFIQLIDAYVDAQLFDFNVEFEQSTDVKRIKFRIKF